MMRSPSAHLVPKVVAPLNTLYEEDAMSITSAFSNTASTSSRKSFLSKVTNASFSSFAAPAWGIGDREHDTTVRVIARIRPIFEEEESSGSFRAVFAIGREDDLPPASFLSPSKTNRRSTSATNDSEGASVADLAAKFNSPSNKPLMPCLETTPTKLFSPSQARTPLRTNGNAANINSYANGRNANGKTPLVRQSFIQSPSTTKEIEDRMRATTPCKASQSVMAGDENFNFDAVSLSI